MQENNPKGQMRYEQFPLNTHLNYPPPFVSAGSSDVSINGHCSFNNHSVDSTYSFDLGHKVGYLEGIETLTQEGQDQYTRGRIDGSVEGLMAGIGLVTTLVGTAYVLGKKMGSSNTRNKLEIETLTTQPLNGR